MLSENFVYLALLIAAAGTLSYLKDTLKGNIQPNKVSYFLWSLAPLITFFAQLKQGVGLQALLPLSIGLATFVIFIASFLNKKAYWKITKFDLACGALSLLGLILWYLTGVGNMAIFFSIFSDSLAAVPTIVKSYKYPETESGWVYFADFLNGFITLLTVRSFNFENIGFPIYYCILSLIIYILVQFKLGKKTTYR